MARISDLLAAGRTVSFEFFPPKTDSAQMSLGRTIAELAPLDPSFVSVTYGAGGSTRERTHQVVTWVRQETSIAPMAHLTCQGHTRSEVDEILENYRAAGVQNILALGGDPPKDPADARPSDYQYASELVDHVREAGDFSVGVAAHPELHPRSPDRATDRRTLAAKMAVADFAITQFFFELEPYVRLVNELADLGVTKPVVPGIMPITNVAQVSRMAEMSGAAVPASVLDRLASAGDDPEHTRLIGVEIATELSAALLDAGAPGLHFYTLNRSTATREVYANLDLANSGAEPGRGANLGTGTT
ncbi:MAG: methylenetetrahydrofolate reductase [NAD(P)H] [Ilumatobacter sp.]|nr:MAG: methylenetetrahydrofolate reductase [NAD(P)H] [Ilumatobacter sp.]